jgi:hypothetical protein
MKQNIYDDPRFYAGYSDLRNADKGLNGVLEELVPRSLLPELGGKRVGGPELAEESRRPPFLLLQAKK